MKLELELRISFTTIWTDAVLDLDCFH